MELAFTSPPAAVPYRLEVLDQHSQIVVQTPATQVEQRRNQVRCAGALLAVTGLVLAPFHLGLLALIPVGVAAAALGPARIRQKVLFRVLNEPEECLITDLAKVMTRSIVRIDATYETSGWEGTTRFTAFITNGEELAVLEIPGTDEALARAACKAMSRLCRCAAQYTGPFGEVTRFDERAG